LHVAYNYFVGEAFGALDAVEKLVSLVARVDDEADAEWEWL
jgi:hypothetical protein